MPAPSRSRRWSLTLNNPSEEEVSFLEALVEMNPPTIKRFFGAFEVGESGTPHIQAYVEYANAKALKAVKKIMGSERWHCEKSLGTPFENHEYILKANPEPDFALGDVPAEVELSPWESILKMIEDGMDDISIIQKYPSIAMRCQSAIARYRHAFQMREMQWRDVEVNYVWGPTGSGKTRSVLYAADGRRELDVFRVTNVKNPWDGYDGQDHVVFEEFRSNWSCRDMLNWLDGHLVELPARYADRLARYTKVTIISNWPFERQYENVQVNSQETYMAWVRRITNIRYLGNQVQ